MSYGPWAIPNDPRITQRPSDEDEVCCSVCGQALTENEAKRLAADSSTSAT